MGTHERGASPETSVIVITWQNLALTRLCVESVLENPDLELVVVDNQSTDGTQTFLRKLASWDPRVRPILNAENRGFPAAVNQGLRLAQGRRLVILNNDVIVPPVGLARLLRHLDDPAVGLVGPRTNHIATEARLPVSYHTRQEMEALAARLAALHEGEIADVSMLALFCAAMRRTTFERVGELDGQFGLGMFEDDDYSLRTTTAGYRVVCALDSFVHHFGGASFPRLLPGLTYEKSFDENRRRFERKWGRPWVRRTPQRLLGTRHL